jgi:thioredoxin 2
LESEEQMPFYIVTCSSCGTGNRIPAEKEGKHGQCGSCHAPLPPLYRTPQQLGGSSFDSFVTDYPGPLLVEFWAPW